MEKLTYERIADVTLKIDLHNGYEVVAMAKHEYEKKKYIVSFYLKDKLVDDLMLIMEDFENIEFKTNSKFICSAILKHVSKNFEVGNFDKYIERCDYYQKCFEEGDEIIKNREKTYVPIKSKIAYREYYYCPKCDCELEEGEEYCPRCGVWMNWEEGEELNNAV